MSGPMTQNMICLIIMDAKVVFFGKVGFRNEKDDDFVYF